MRPAPRKITRGPAAREAMFKGLEEAALTILTTLGPAGKQVGIIRADAVNFATKDGVTVARELHHEDMEEEYGANLLAQAAFATSQDSGDGTTSCTCLAYALVGRFMQTNPGDIREYLRGARLAKQATLEELAKYRKDVDQDSDELARIAEVSCNNDEALGAIVSHAYKEVGSQGAIQIKQGGEDTVEILDGMVVPFGWKTSHYYFITDMRRAAAVYDDATVLVIPEIEDIAQLAALLERCFKQQKPVVLFYQQISDECRDLLLLNRQRSLQPSDPPASPFPVLPIKVMSGGDRAPHAMEDIAARTNCSYFPAGTTLSSVKVEDLGHVDHIEASADETNFIAPSDTKAYADHAERLRGELESSLNVDKEYLNERVARFLGKAAIIYVHGHIDQEVQAKQFLVEDAVLACKTALEQGIMPGGGISYVWAQKKIKHDDLLGDAQLGFIDIAKSLPSIFTQIAENCGLEGEGLLKELNVRGKGKKLGSYDFIERKWGGTAVDPYMSQVNVIDNAYSVFESFVQTDALVTEIATDNNE